jgi:hypothetical protein
MTMTKYENEDGMIIQLSNYEQTSLVKKTLPPHFAPSNHQK